MELSKALADEIREALEGDSNDAEHDALVAVAQTFGIRYVIEDDLPFADPLQGRDPDELHERGR